MGRLLLALSLAVILVGRLRGEQDGQDVRPPCDPAEGQCVAAPCAAPSERLSVPEEVVLVLGKTGTGKSALSKYLSHNDRDMTAVSVDDGYLITGDRIGSGVDSVTTVPELVTDNATGTHYFDCPGFEDTRGPCVEVSTTYYMKDITRKAKRVKVLFLTQYFAVRPGQNRHDFVDSLLHVARILRSPSKMRDSVALVVTKVDDDMEVDGEWVATPDASIRASIASFVRDSVVPYLAEMEAEITEPAESETYRRASEILDMFGYDGNDSRIGIFRAPDEEGPLQDIALMQTGREELLDLVHNKLRYAEVQPGDFGFSVSDRTKLFALTQADKLSRAVVGKLTSLGLSIADSRARRVYDHGDIPSTADNLLAEARKLRRLAGDLKTSASVQAFCDRLTRDVQGGPEGAQAAEVAADARYLDVLQVVSDKPLVDGGVLASQWALPFDEAADLLAAGEEWHRFLIALYGRLNEYEELRLRSRDSKTYPAVSNQTLPSFVSETGLILTASTLRMLPVVAVVSDLNTMLDRVRQRPDFECVAAGWRLGLLVRAESVLMSDVVAAIPAHCSGAARVVEVYALNTVFVDVDVKLDGIDLAIVAPRWVVRGRSRIVLDGAPGDAPSRNWRLVSPGEDGPDGEAGEPGHPGNNFLGVGRDFVGAVRVSVVGGQGGKGQDGVDGAPGTAGGGDGGDGGNGGKGGFGGSSGRGLVVDLGGPHSLADIAVEARGGAEGPPGRGGRGGDRRPHSGPPLRYRRRKRFVITGLVLGGLALAGIGAGVYYASRTTEPPPRYYVPQYSDGRRGADGQSRASRSWPQPARVADWSDVPSRMETYFQHNADHPYLKAGLREFLRLAAADPAFTRLATPYNEHLWVF